MKKTIFFLLLLAATTAFSQQTKFTFDWETIKTNDKIPKREALWLKDSLTNTELTKVINLVSDLSRPAVSQLLVSHFYLDGSFKWKSVQPYLDSLTVRPPDGEAGIVRVAYLVSKLRKKRIEIQKSSKYYVAQFSGVSFKLPKYEERDINKNIVLSFDYQPAQLILDILSRSDVSYHEILDKVNLHQFVELIDHRNQSFYTTPLNKERLATCLQIASSTKPIDKLYKYMNPDGLLYFTDVKTHLAEYKKQLVDLSKNEQNIFKYINASISPLLPPNTEFSRKVSFFFINDADGWASGDVTALDLNYYKDSYEKLLPLLVHETYHSGQHAVARNDETKHEENVQSFIDVMDYLFGEGTATYIAAPSAKTKEENELAIKEGIKLMEGIYTNTITKYDAIKTRELQNKGIVSAGPFYWLGAEMSKVIVDELGKGQLAAIIPNGGILFLKTYFKAVEKSKKTINMFSDTLTKYILNKI